MVDPGPRAPPSLPPNLAIGLTLGHAAAATGWREVIVGGQGSNARVRRGLLANIAIAGAGTAAGQIVTLVGAPIVARFFGPEAFGVASIFGTLVGIVAVVGSLRYDMAIPLPSEERGASALLGLSILISVGVGALTALGFLLFGDTLLSRLDAMALAPWWWVFGLGATLTALASPLRLFFQRADHFSTVAGASLAGALVGTAGCAVAGLLGASSGVALVLLRTSTLLLTLPAVLVAVLALRPGTVGWVRPKIADLRAVAFRYRSFPLVTTSAALLDIVGRQAPQLILAALFDASVVGLYAMAVRLVSLPSQFLSTSVAAVFFQHAASARAAGDNEGFRRDVLGVACRLSAVGLLPVTIVALIGPTVVALVFGERWQEAGTYVAILAPVVFAMFVTSPMTVLFSVLELHRVNVVTQGAMVVVRSAALLVGARIAGDARGALIAYAVLVPLATAVQQAWILGAAGVSRRAYFGHLVRHVAFMMPCLAGWYGLANWTSLGQPWVIAATLVLSLIYVALAVREDPEVLSVGRRLLRRLGLSRDTTA